jgi:hypothetical protein
MPKENRMKWISVEEELPEEVDLVLVWLNCEFISIGYVSDGEWSFQAEIVWFVADECEVTHWMHLPPLHLRMMSLDLPTGGYLTLTPETLINMRAA